MKRLILSLVLMWIVYIVGRELYYQVSYLWMPASLILNNYDSVEMLEGQILEEFKKLSGEGAEKVILDDAYKLSSSYVDLNGDTRKDLIVTMDSKDTCGNTGCMTTIFLQNQYKTFESIHFAFATEKVEILESVTNGMRDLRINSDASNRMVWNGRSYELESI